MTKESTKSELTKLIQSFNSKGWSPATSTNYSFRLLEDPNTIFVSRSGVDKAYFTENDFMTVDLNGNPTGEFISVKPSAETLIHCAVYSMFPETTCILHTHSLYSVLMSQLEKGNSLSIEGYEVLKGFQGITTHDTTVQCPIFENTQDMNALFHQLIKSKDQLAIPALLLRKHGTYAWGNDLSSAKRHLETIEYLLECEWNVKTKLN